MTRAATLASYGKSCNCPKPNVQGSICPPIGDVPDTDASVGTGRGGTVRVPSPGRTMIRAIIEDSSRLPTGRSDVCW